MARRERLNVEMIVEAISSGFDKVQGDIQKLAAAQAKAATSSQQVTSAFGQQDSAQQAMATRAALLTQKYAELEQANKRLTTAVLASGAALTAVAAVEFKAVAGATQLAARVETLGVVTETLGKNVGWSAERIHALEDSIKAQGITTQAARQSIARMIQAQVDLRHATDLARIAQNAAVIANTDSSQAFNHLIQAIATANVRMVRNLGMAVTFEAAYKKMADTLGITTDQLTEAQKTTARVNAIMQASVQISGAYENAMETAGKKANSLARVQEEAALAIGNSFIPTYTVIIDLAYEALNAFNALDAGTKEGVGTLMAVSTAGTAAAGGFLLIVGAARKAKQALDSFTSAGAALGATSGAIAVAAAAVAALAAAVTLAIKTHQDMKAAYKEESAELDKVGQSWEDYIMIRTRVARDNGLLFDDELDKVREYIFTNDGMLGSMNAQNFTFYNRLKALELTTKAQYSLNEAYEMGTVGVNAFGQAVNLMSPKFDAWRAGIEKLDLTELVKTGQLDPSEAIERVKAFYDEINSAAAQTLKEAQERILAQETEIEIKMRLSDTGISTAIQKYMDELEFALAGGDQLSIAFEAVKLGIEKNKLTPEEGRQALEGLLVAAEDIMAEASLKTREEAAEFVAEKMQMSVEEALMAMETADPTAILDTIQQKYESLKSAEARDAMLIGAGEIEPLEDGAAAMQEWKAAAEELVTPMESIKTTTEDIAPAANDAATEISGTSESMGDLAETTAEANAKLSAQINFIRMLKSKSITITTKFVTEGSPPTGGGGGGGNAFMAQGGDFIVPPGFPNDTFTVHVSSGERVTVQNAMQQREPTGPIRQDGGDVVINQYYQSREAAAMGNALIALLENNRLNAAMGG